MEIYINLQEKHVLDVADYSATVSAVSVAHNSFAVSHVGLRSCQTFPLLQRFSLYILAAILTRSLIDLPCVCVQSPGTE